MPEATIHRLDEYDEESREDPDALLAQLWADYVTDRDPGLSRCRCGRGSGA